MICISQPEKPQTKHSLPHHTQIITQPHFPHPFPACHLDLLSFNPVAFVMDQDPHLCLYQGNHCTVCTQPRSLWQCWQGSKHIWGSLKGMSIEKDRIKLDILWELLPQHTRASAAWSPTWGWTTFYSHTYHQVLLLFFCYQKFTLSKPQPKIRSCKKHTIGTWTQLIVTHKVDKPLYCQ